MSKLIDKIKTVPPNKTGGLRKHLCCNCLGEDFTSDGIIFSKCLSCGAMNDRRIMVIITYWEPTGHEL